MTQQLAAAAPGDTIRLTPDFYPVVVLRGKTWAEPVTLDARGSNLAGMKLDDVGGLRIQGGTFTGTISEPHSYPVITLSHGRDVTFDGIKVTGTGRTGFGLNIRWGEKVTVTGSSFTGLHTGIILNDTQHSQVTNTSFASMASDGVDIADSHFITVDNIECSDFHVVAPDHPDCVQLWSIKGKPPVSDITVKNSRATGTMQGISGFDHGDGGFDRITVTGNTIRTTYSHGIALFSARDSLIEGNRIETLPGAQWPARISIGDGTRIVQKHNKVVTPPDSYLKPPPR